MSHLVKAEYGDGKTEFIYSLIFYSTFFIIMSLFIELFHSFFLTYKVCVIHRYREKLTHNYTVHIDLKYPAYKVL